MSLTPQDMAELERSNAIFVLLAIDKYPGISKRGITTMCDVNVRTRYQRIQELTDLGLIEYEDGPRYNSKLLKLTPEGQEIANKLKKIRYTILRLKRQKEEEEKHAEIDSDLPQKIISREGTDMIDDIPEDEDDDS